MDVKEKIREKLINYELTTFDKLEDKTVKRLSEIETCVSEMESEAKELEKRLKDLKPNVTKIIACDKVSITKKTAYNNPIILRYIETSIKNFPDYLNEQKIEKMQKNYDELNDMYYKVIDNIIEDYNRKNERILLLEAIDNLKKENDTLREIISEKDKEILNAKKNNKVISINKFEK
ncbi:hypothetical protein [Clostridium akagii]|uniref:hypothetical protein n=1 Tax=Clostridium akagii TaxID=91623 RepID=UPI00047A2E40|nr:hypothetical protein [Clostridium akagii]